MREGLALLLAPYLPRITQRKGMAYPRHPGKETGQKLMAWLNGERSNGNGQEEAPVEPQPQSKPVIVPMPPKAPLPPVQTKHGTTVADVLNVLCELGSAFQACSTKTTC